MREVASEMQSTGAPTAPSTSCLDELSVAEVVEARDDMSARPEIIVHLAACARCRDQVVAVARVLRDPLVAAEVRRFSASPVALPTRRWRGATLGAMTAVAAAVTLMVVSSADRAPREQSMAGVKGTPVHREQSITAAAPNLIGPLGMVAAADTFRWTSVPRADRYRVTVFAQDGTVIWEKDATDTTMTPPDPVAGGAGTTYQWRVEARTGWDRWVASDLVEFSLLRAGRIP